MVTTRFASVPVVLATMLALQGCQLIGGIEERTLSATDAGTDAVEDGQPDVQPDVEPDVIDTSCELPSVGNATMRIGNLIPSFDRVDFCIKSAEQAWADVKPVLAGSGGGCPRGMAYRNVSALFEVQAGVYDVIAVEDPGSGARPVCTATALAQANQVVINEGESISALLFGDTLAGSTLRAWKGSKALGVNESAMRFVNALVGAGALNCGVADKDSLPASITSEAFTNVAFASISAAGNPAVGRIDENGYLQLQVGGATLSFAVTKAGEVDAILIKAEKYDRGVAYTSFAAGRVGDKQFPPEMFICDESKADGIFGRCGGLPMTLTVDSANVQLAGAFGPFDKDRTPVVQSAIAELPSDVVCVQEAWGKQLREAIVAAAASKFPHKATFDYNLDSPVDDPTDRSGATPEAFTEAPCAQSEALFTAALNCVRDNCVEPKASEQGTPAAGLSDCMTSKCIANMLPILSGTPEDKACYSCMFANLAAWETVDYIRNQCSTVPNARYAHRGDSALVVLSKHPIQNAESWVLPATEWRVNVVRAPVSLPNGAVVDVYCTQLTTPAEGIARPYTGQYGNGTTGADAWREELYLQADKLVAYVQDKSASVGRKAVIVGSLYAGPEYFDGATKVLEAVNVPAYNSVSSAFPLAVPQDYVPTCTLCTDNLILAPPGTQPSGANTWMSFVFLSGIPVTAVESAERFWTDTALTVINPDTSDPFDIPLSTHYGFRSVIRVLK